MSYPPAARKYRGLPRRRHLDRELVLDALEVGIVRIDVVELAAERAGLQPFSVGDRHEDLAQPPLAIVELLRMFESGAQLVLRMIVVAIQQRDLAHAEMRFRERR